MSLLDKALKQGKQSLNKAVSNAVTNTVEKKVTNAVTAKVNDAVEKAADAIVPTPEPKAPSAEQQQRLSEASAQLGGLFAGLTGAAQSFATEAAKNMKICPACGEAAGADTQFCPQCGARLPEQTAAQGSVCTGCGKQNVIGTKFCADCGTKLPSAVAEEEAAKAKSEAALARWDDLLPQYPKWNQGGHDLILETGGEGENGRPYYMFCAGGAGEREIAGYSALLKQNGFKTAGQYPSEGQLYKKVDGLVYNFDSERAFDGGSDGVCLYFTVGEPSGGYDYVKPEPQKPPSLRDLFKR